MLHTCSSSGQQGKDEKTPLLVSAQNWTKPWSQTWREREKEKAGIKIEANQHAASVSRMSFLLLACTSIFLC